MDNKLKPCPFKKGDILLNHYAGDENPSRFVMFLRCCTIRQGRYTHRGYNCMNWKGEKSQYFRDESQFEKVGHMQEYDSFLAALKKLNRRSCNVD